MAAVRVAGGWPWRPLPYSPTAVGPAQSGAGEPRLARALGTAMNHLNELVAADGNDSDDYGWMTDENDALAWISPGASRASHAAKLLFLDIDGVCNTDGTHDDPNRISLRNWPCELSLPHLRNLKYILDSTGADIVLSSNWRLVKLGCRALVKGLRAAHIACERVVGATPDMRPDGTRADEIFAWLSARGSSSNVVGWAAVDDLPLEGQNPSGMRGHAVRTDIATGLDADAMARCIAILNGEVAGGKRKLPSSKKKKTTDEGTSAETSAPLPGRCHLYLPKKGRYCSFDVISGYNYCGHHLAARAPSDVASAGSERIPCPLDGSHSIFAKDLQRHLKVCPRAKDAAAEAALPCFRRDCNAGDDAQPPADVVAAARRTETDCAGAGQPLALRGADTNRTGRHEPAPLSAVPTETVRSLIARLRAAHAAHVVQEAAPPPPAVVAAAAEAATEAGDEARGRKFEKHAAQHAAMVAVLRTLGGGRLLDTLPPARVIELGAGKGGLAGAISAAAPQASIVLVDWSKPHQSVDSVLRERGVRCARYKMDLRHLWIRGVPELWPAPPSVDEAGEGTTRAHDEEQASACLPCDDDGGGPRVAVAKHLCGCATDFGLRSLVGASDMGNSGRPRASISAMMLATCCHHRCTWGSYVNQTFLTDAGFDAADFPLIALLSSWATVGTAPPAAAADRSARSTAPVSTAPAPPGPEATAASAEDDEHGGALPEAAMLSESFGSELDGAARTEIGRMCKRLLDTGRLRYLEAHGYTGGVRRYIDAAVSPENVVLVAEAAAGRTKEERRNA